MLHFWVKARDFTILCENIMHLLIPNPHSHSGFIRFQHLGQVQDNVNLHPHRNDNFTLIPPRHKVQRGGEKPIILFINCICNLYAFNLDFPALAVEYNGTEAKAEISQCLCKAVSSYPLHSAPLCWWVQGRTVHDPTFQGSFKAAGVRCTFFGTHDPTVAILNHSKQFARPLPLPPFNFLYVSS